MFGHCSPMIRRGHASPTAAVVWVAFVLFTVVSPLAAQHPPDPWRFSRAEASSPDGEAALVSFADQQMTVQPPLATQPLMAVDSLPGQTLAQANQGDPAPFTTTGPETGSGPRASTWSWAFTPSVVTSSVILQPAAAGEIPAGAEQPPIAQAAAIEPEFQLQPRFWWAASEVTLANVMDWMNHRFILQAGWTHVSPKTWVSNVTGGLQWDYDPLEINNVTHPFSGSQYFNAARANGYGFWASGAFAMGGSVMWEYLAETQSPSPNDLINTYLGGMVYGEVGWRVSACILDDKATGVNRFLRELSSLLINPGLGVHRVIHGDAWHTRQSMPAVSHGPIGLDLQMGPRQSTSATPIVDQRLTSLQPSLSFRIAYGDPFEFGSHAVFSTFTLQTEMTGPLLTRLSVAGMLARPSLTGTDEDRSLIGLELESEYLTNAAYRFAASNLTLRHSTRRGTAHGWRLGSTVGATGVILGAVSNGQPFRPGRDYDYGPGMGLRLGGQVEYSGQPLLSVGYDGYWLHSLMGPTSTNWLQNAGVQVRTPRLIGLYGAVDYQVYWHMREFHSGRTDRLRSQQLSVFLGLSGQ